MHHRDPVRRLRRVAGVRLHRPGAHRPAEGNGREIVIKVIRPDIEPVIDADLRLMQALARLVARFVPQSARLRPVEVVEEYRKTILDELNLMREAANAIQLRRNFTGSGGALCARGVHGSLP